MSAYIIPLLILILLIYCLAKKIAIFDSFCEGASGAIPLVISLFPFLVGIFFMVELMEVSGLSEILEDLISPILEFFGVPSGIARLVIFRPFSGSGSLAILQEIFQEYGVDSFEGRVASCVCGAGETVFYLVAVYFSTAKIKNVGKITALAICCTFVGIMVSALCCRLI